MIHTYIHTCMYNHEGKNYNLMTNQYSLCNIIDIYTKTYYLDLRQLRLYVDYTC